MHGKMEFRIIPVNRVKEFVHAYIRIELFVNLANKRILRRFALFHLSSGEFPPVFEISISTLGGKNLILFPYNGGDYFYCLLTV